MDQLLQPYYSAMSETQQTEAEASMEAQYEQMAGSNGTDAWADTTTTIPPDAHVLVSFDSGYLLFVTLACEVAVAFCILWSTWLRRFDLALVWQGIRPAGYASFGRHMCNVTHILAFQCMIIALTWTVSLSPMYYYHTLLRLAVVTSSDILPDPPIVGWFGCALAVIFLAFPLFNLSSFLMHPGARSGIYLLGTTLLLMLPGLTLLAVYCHRMSILAQYSYHGPMRMARLAVHTVLGQRPQSTSGLRGWVSGKSDGAVFYIGQSYVEWGADWGCPESPTTWCRAIVDDPSCTYCDPNSTNDGGLCQGRYGEPKNARHCLLEKHNLWEFSDRFPLEEADGDEVPENDNSAIPNNRMRQLSSDESFLTLPKSIRPDHAPDEPYGTWYGDCRSCHVIPSELYTQQVEYLKILKPIGATLTITGGIIYLILSLWICIPKIAAAWRIRMRQRRERGEQQRQLAEHRREMNRRGMVDGEDIDDGSILDIRRSDAMQEESVDSGSNASVIEEQVDDEQNPDPGDDDRNENVEDDDSIVFGSKSIGRGKSIRLGQTFTTEPSSDFDEEGFDDSRFDSFEETHPQSSTFLIDLDNVSTNEDSVYADDNHTDGDNASTSSLGPIIVSRSSDNSDIRALAGPANLSEDAESNPDSWGDMESDDESVYTEH